MTEPRHWRTRDDGSRHAEYHPLMLVFVSVAIGIVADRYLAVSWMIWWALITCAVALGLSRGVPSNRPFRACVILVFAAALAGVWHHVHWQLIDTRDISLFAKTQPHPVLIQGKLVSQPKWILDSGHDRSANRRRGPKSRFELKVTAVRDKQSLVPARGVVDVLVAGQVSGLLVGSQLQLSGWLSRTGPPSNPGQFDFQQFSRSQGKRCWLNVGHPDCVRLIGHRSTPLTNLISRTRLSFDQLMWEYLRPQQAALASAMLLGNRQQLDKIRQQQFLASGTLHLLAISGLHVGILASFFLWLPKLGIVSRRSGLLITLLFVAGYAWLVEFRPPVVRAAILIGVICYCKWIGRQAFSVNSLAMAGLIVLLANPTDLFSTGAQLSFVAVGSLMYFHRGLSRGPPRDPIDKLVANTRPRFIKLARRIGRATKATVLASGIIWVLALPLVALKFHVVAPIALVANPLLMLPIGCALFCGFGVIVFGWLFPPLAHLFGFGANASLTLILKSVEWFQRVPGSHFWTAGPTEWSVVTFYLVVILVVVFKLVRVSSATVATAAACWLIAGWILPNWLAPQDLTRRQLLCATAIDVGHGCCVLLQLPNGHNMLYDCGSFGSPELGQRNASGVLWHQRISKIDTVVISHADSDHFNALPKLARLFTIGRVVVSNQMIGDPDPLTKKLLSELRSQGISLEAVSRGDTVFDAADCKVTVLGPTSSGHGRTDNANSIVLEVECRDFRFLLPGDLENEGMDELLNTAPRRFDLVLAPHHGSSGSSPQAFLKWCRPRWAIVSGHGLAPIEEFRNQAEAVGCRVFHTGRDGAVRVEIPRDGEVRVQSWLHEPW